MMNVEDNFVHTLFWSSVELAPGLDVYEIVKIVVKEMCRVYTKTLEPHNAPCFSE